MADAGHYWAATDPIAGSASAQNLLSIENPTGSGRSVMVRSVAVASVQTALSVLVVSYRFGRTTALPTGGTTLTAQGMMSTDSSVAVVRSGPTATAAAGGVGILPSAMVLGLALSGTSPWLKEYIFGPADEGQHLELAPGEGALVRVSANLTTFSHMVSIAWCEGNI